MMADWLTQQREQAWAAYQRLLMPPKQDELWRRTDWTLVQPARWEVAPPCTPQFSLPAVLSRQGVVLEELAVAAARHPQIRQYLGQILKPDEQKLVALNTARWNVGAFLYIPPNVAVEEPIRLTTAAPTAVGGAFMPRLLIVVDRGASAQVVDELTSPPGSAGGIGVVELVLQEGAQLKYTRLQRLSEQTVLLTFQRSQVAKDAQLATLAVELGGRLVRPQIETRLEGAGARSELFGLAVGDGAQQFDLHTLQDHAAPQTFSDLLYKSVVKDLAKAIYIGLIHIRQQAQRSDAYQANKNLLLSERATTDSIPMLEIEADDVRCTHGVAVGPVDEEQEFYLMSRGLSQGASQRMIVEGFLRQVLDRAQLNGVRDIVQAAIDEKLHAILETSDDAGSR